MHNSRKLSLPPPNKIPKTPLPPSPPTRLLPTKLSPRHKPGFDSLVMRFSFGKSRYNLFLKISQIVLLQIYMFNFCMIICCLSMYKLVFFVISILVRVCWKRG